MRRPFRRREFPHYAWGTLAERCLYEHVPFEPGVLFEDIYASADLVLRLSEVVLVEAGLYGYTQRVGSICNPTEPDERLLRDNLAAIRHFEGAVGEWARSSPLTHRLRLRGCIPGCARGRWCFTANDNSQVVINRNVYNLSASPVATAAAESMFCTKPLRGS